MLYNISLQEKKEKKGKISVPVQNVVSNFHKKAFYIAYAKIHLGS